MKLKEYIGKTVDMPHYVSYGETDAMGVVYYAEYLHICERARNYLGHEIGFNYKEMEENDGLYLPVREAQIRYKVSAKFDELIYVRIGITEWNRASLEFSYQILNENKDIIITEASTLHACIDKNFKVKPIPEKYKALFL